MAHTEPRARRTSASGVLRPGRCRSHAALTRFAISSANNQNYKLLQYTAGVAALIGARVVPPIKKVK